MDLLRSAPLPMESCSVAPQGGCCCTNPLLPEEAREAIVHLTFTPASADPRLNASVTHSVNPISTESNRQPLASQTELQID